MFHTIGIYLSVFLEIDFLVNTNPSSGGNIPNDRDAENVSHCLIFDPVGISYHYHNNWTHPYTAPWLDINDSDLDNHQNHTVTILTISVHVDGVDDDDLELNTI